MEETRFPVEMVQNYGDRDCGFKDSQSVCIRVCVVPRFVSRGLKSVIRAVLSQFVKRQAGNKFFVVYAEHLVHNLDEPRSVLCLA